MKTPSNSALGIQTNFASGQSAKKHENRNEWVKEIQRKRYRLQKKSAELLPDYRVNSACMKPLIPHLLPTVWVNQETGKAHLSGLSKCGSVWVCPICASKISMGRRAEISEALELAGKAGWKVLFVTLTARHDRGQNLTDLMDKFKKAKRYLRSGRKWQSVKQDYLVKGGVTATEITWGFKNGWHVHFHEVLFVGAEVDPEEVENRFFALWNRALNREGMDCSRERGVRVLLGSEHVADYITKWGLDLELSSTEKSGRNGNFSPFQLLDLYAQGEDWAGGLFQQYADATKGKASLRWSRGLRDKLGLGEALTDQELAEAQERENNEALIMLTRAEFNKLLYSGRDEVIAELLSVAESGRSALSVWLAEMFDIHPQHPT